VHGFNGNFEGSWCEYEFETIDCGDPRINRRFIQTAQKLSERPVASINMACESWARAKGAYRMFGSEKLSHEEILRAHRDKLNVRIEPEPFIFAIQDTTFLNFTEHFKTLGLGHIGSGPGRRDSKGLMVHTTLAMASSGQPLGLLDQQVVSRTQAVGVNKARRARTVNIEEKESYRWLKAVRAAQDTLGKIPSQIVHIADREADIYEFMSEAVHVGGHFLVRAKWDRVVAAQGESENHRRLWTHMVHQPLAAKQVLEVPVRQASRSMRTAHLEIRFGRVRLEPAKGQKKPVSTEVLPFLDVFAVWVHEPHAPKGIKPLEWMLLTDIEVNDAHDAIERLNWYKLRWRIEDYHKVLKTDCTVEECRLENVDRLEKYIATVGIIAWRILWMTYINRTNPEWSCTQVLQEHEWKALYCKIHQTAKLPACPPSTYQVVRWIAQLGGFLGRKGDKEPGILTISRGWQRLMDIAEAYLIFNPQTCG
jgi:hypothetical protein